MSRQVDVKALVSHIVRGDGADKCRICMGDTAEGQVFLGDTVMMDGDKAVTLAELLELITGVEVGEEPALPQGLCRSCSEQAMAAVRYRQLCLQSNQQWRDATVCLAQIHAAADEDKTFFVLYNGRMMIIKDQVARIPNETEAVKRINLRFTDPEVDRPPKRVKRSFPPVSCQCPDCDKSFSNTEFLNFHLKTSLKRACQVCGVVMPKKNLAKHLQEKHNVSVVECSVCHSNFDTHQQLDQHNATAHGPDTFSCHCCGSGFSNHRALRAHMYSHTLFHCNACGASFENRKCYKYHQKQCKRPGGPQEDVFICDYCNIEYNRKPSLRIHMIQKHLNINPYVCQVCGKRASTMAHLKSHMKTHNATRSVFQCHCGAKMRTEVGYQLHQRIHSGERPYECETCGDRFLSASRRLDHIKRRHRGTADMPHACYKCSATFIRPWELRKHFVTVHNDVMEQPVKPREGPIRRRFKSKLKL
ncbi:oocyte zinc finger protein XlCOF6 isoform X2 [Manduca sexta]|uniref:oocyte zinc finger protein XlCOF6 isoform X2 n=1 Tax=Manduca sexta TaxID=7130 RepID=UPI00188F4064|nr:oocyte zinc finger protein XlCOF6 isoform X2 [Manduca sexta]